jgi:hypothetical protein
VPKKYPTFRTKLIRAAHNGVALLEAFEKLAVRLFLFAMLVYALIRAFGNR